MFGLKLGHQHKALYITGSKKRHVGNDIAQVINTSSQLMHLLLINSAYDVKIVINVCYECLTNSNHPTLHIL